MQTPTLVAFDQSVLVLPYSSCPTGQSIIAVFLDLIFRGTSDGAWASDFTILFKDANFPSDEFIDGSYQAGGTPLEYGGYSLIATAGFATIDRLCI